MEDRQLNLRTHCNNLRKSKTRSPKLIENKNHTGNVIGLMKKESTWLNYNI